jgi:FtsP/CotA-like multicopper oxidase with cupredoxin domain
MGFMNGVSWKPQLPPLLSLSRASWDENQNVQFVNGSATSKPRRVRVIINNADDSAHSFHQHGSPFYVLASYRAPGRAEFPGKYDHEHPESGELRGGDKPGGWVNHDNPVRRDAVTVPRWGHVLIAFVANNPGLWLLHCHMLVHQGVGMAAGFQIGESDDFDHTKAQNPAAADSCRLSW